MKRLLDTSAALRVWIESFSEHLPAASEHGNGGGSCNSNGGRKSIVSK